MDGDENIFVEENPSKQIMFFFNNKKNICSEGTYAFEDGGVRDGVVDAMVHGDGVSRRYS